MTEPDFERVAIVGLGLMGGSMALALQARRSASVIGIDSDPGTLQQAAARGIKTSQHLDDVSNADLIILATPVRVILQLLPNVGKLAVDGSVVLDLGSTKRDIVSRMEELPARIHPIGAHPMCGKEKAGFAAADPELYRDAAFVLTPTSRTSPKDLERVEHFVRHLGARPIVLSAERHDQLVAAVSHLPFAVATTLMDLATSLAENDDCVFELAAGGFRDTSRLAASDVTMMLDTLLTNRRPVAGLIRDLSRSLAVLADSVEAGDEAALKPLLERTSRIRRELFT